MVFLALRVQVLRIIVNCEPVLRSFDLDQLDGRSEFRDSLAGAADWYQGVGVSVGDQSRRRDFAQRFFRLEPEDFVQQRPTVLQGRRELNGASLVQLCGSFIADDVVRPVITAVDRAPFVVELRIQQY
ncbi:hypothetical protein [Nocardia nova]|uniref:hypothetical protein n=1 Tax=Nocardia nova TaxID=37330 RepID=UPI0015E3207D|nr:hypothetical protein [Nocardia nova]